MKRKLVTYNSLASSKINALSSSFFTCASIKIHDTHNFTFLLIHVDVHTHELDIGVDQHKSIWDLEPSRVGFP